MLDFKRIKEIKLTDVLARYKIPLRFNSGYAVCPCPLPIHKKGDTSRSFSINLDGNYWRCFSDSCNANNGGRRGGDVINFVALMEGCKEKDAAQKLAAWYGIETADFVSNGRGNVYKQKAPTHTEQGPKQEQENQMQRTISNNDSPAVAGKPYMASIDQWFNETFKPREDEDLVAYYDRLRKAVKNQLVESYRAGQKSR